MVMQQFVAQEQLVPSFDGMWWNLEDRPQKIGEPLPILMGEESKNPLPAYIHVTELLLILAILFHPSKI